MRRRHSRHRDRWALPRLHAAARAPERQTRTARSHRHDRAACGVCGPGTACGADRPARRGGECAPVVRVDVSHSKTRNPGVSEMKPSAICRLVSAVLLIAAAPVAAQTSLSIYRDGRVVVRRTLPQALQQGRNALTLRLEALDPATLFSTDTSVSVVTATVRYPSAKNDALARAIGQTLSFVRSVGDTVKATIVRVDPPQYRLPDGRLLLEQPGEPLFPAELVRTAPEAQVVLDAARGRPRTDIAYVAQGVTWEALYQVILTCARAQVTRTANVTSQALRADSAELQLVAGAGQRTRKKSPHGGGAPGGVLPLPGAAHAAESPTEESAGETPGYQLPS